MSIQRTLDPQTSKIILENKSNSNDNDGMITFMITHNMEDAIKYGNRLIMLHKVKLYLILMKRKRKI